MKSLAGVLALLACGCGDAASQAQDCKDWVACSYKTGVAPRSLDATFGPNGTCWEYASAYESCQAGCKSANDILKSSGVAADAGCTFF
jgi:hypothetical protein